MTSDTTLYLALARQDALFRQLDVASNNAANVNTDGFKEQTLYFQEFLTKETNKRDVTFANDVVTLTDFGNGPLKQTSRQLDVALEGEGFFAVNTPDGVRYTREGHFNVSPEGQIITPSGLQVVGTGGPLVLAPEDTQITIGENGSIYAGDARELRGQIAVFTFENPFRLERLGTGLYQAPDDEAPRGLDILNPQARVLQGMLEESNVNEVQTTTELVKLSRDGGSTARILSEVRELQRSTIDTFLRQQ